MVLNSQNVFVFDCIGIGLYLWEKRNLMQLLLMNSIFLERQEHIAIHGVECLASISINVVVRDLILADKLVHLANFFLTLPWPGLDEF